MQAYAAFGQHYAIDHTNSYYALRPNVKERREEADKLKVQRLEEKSREAPSRTAKNQVEKSGEEQRPRREATEAAQREQRRGRAARRSFAAEQRR